MGTYLCIIAIGIYGYIYYNGKCKDEINSRLKGDEVMEVTDGELVEKLAREAERLKILEVLRKSKSLEEAISTVETLDK